MARLQNKTALITGAAGGIGAAIARAFVAEGATRVWLADTAEEAGGALARSLGAAARFERLDVTVAADWDRVMARIETEGGALHVLVNNAGIAHSSVGPQDPEHADLAAWRHIFAVNLDGVVLGCRTALAAMTEGGAVINMASRAGAIGVPLAPAYAASKAAVLSHTKSVALYCAARGLSVRCNAISPAATLTPMWDPMLAGAADREAALAAIVKDTPVQSFTDPAEVAALAVLLASDEAATLTGAELTVDGGLSAGPLDAAVRTLLTSEPGAAR